MRGSEFIPAEPTGIYVLDSFDYKTMWRQWHMTSNATLGFHIRAAPMRFELEP
jgi:hypothetical protein